MEQGEKTHPIIFQYSNMYKGFIECKAYRAQGPGDAGLRDARGARDKGAELRGVESARVQGVQRVQGSGGAGCRAHECKGVKGCKGARLRGTGQRGAGGAGLRGAESTGVQGS